MFDTFLLTPIRLFVWLIFLGTAYDFLLKRTWDKWRMGMIQRALTDHILVIGFGTSGAEATRELIARGTDPTCIVVIDPRATAIAEAEALGVTVLEGDATRDRVLEDVRVDKARAILVSAGRDDASILIVLTARRLAHHVPISVSIRAEDNEPLARQAGANTVINPVSFTGILLAGSTHGPHIADYIADLASCSGRVALSERKVRDEEVGRSLRDISTGLGVRLYRAGKPYGFWSAEAGALRPGDLIVEIVQGNEPRLDQ